MTTITMKNVASLDAQCISTECGKEILEITFQQIDPETLLRMPLVTIELDLMPGYPANETAIAIANAANGGRNG